VADAPAAPAAASHLQVAPDATINPLHSSVTTSEAQLEAQAAAAVTGLQAAAAVAQGVEPHADHALALPAAQAAAGQQVIKEEVVQDFFDDDDDDDEDLVEVSRDDHADCINKMHLPSVS
jgi:hypothetical protein